MISPYILPQRLTGYSYLTFIANSLPDLLEDAPLGRSQLWLTHDGGPSHFTITVREHLHNTYPEQCVGHGETVTWLLFSII